MTQIVELVEAVHHLCSITPQLHVRVVALLVLVWEVQEEVVVPVSSELAVMAGMLRQEKEETVLLLQDMVQAAAAAQDHMMIPMVVMVVQEVMAVLY
jgi:hypothetical protein